MSYTRSILGTLAAVLSLAAPAAAQDYPPQDHAVTVFARSGGYNAFTALNDAGTADFKKVGYNVGGGLGVDLSRLFAVRADFTYAHNQFRRNETPTGTDINHFFYDASVQLQYPTSAGLKPYLFAGGGAVTIHPIGTSNQDRTKAAGTFGVGLNYTLPGTQAGLFIEGKSWLYNSENLSPALAGTDKLQYEIAWTGGLSYRLPF